MYEFEKNLLPSYLPYLTEDLESLQVYVISTGRIKIKILTT